MKYIQLFLAAYLTITTPWANGYELATHGALTYQAYLKSNLNTNALLQDLGIDRLLVSPNVPNPFGDTYYDVQGGTINTRSANAFESTIIKEDLKKILSVEPLTLPGWLMRGAIREDDAEGEKNPPDPVNPTLKRPLHHFYDPANNRPLSIPGLSLIDSDVHTAPAWAVGSRDVFTQPNTAEANRRNHFTVFDAREAMYRAVTGKTKDGLDAGPNVTAATESIRKTYWATLFRALGDILHLNQDMAQPQHTRNDPHSGKGPTLVQQLFTGHKSFYENYIEARATGLKFTPANGPAVNSKPLNTQICSASGICSDYPIPAFTKYSDYWSTAPGSTGGKGLADYSNRSTLVDTAA